MSIAFEGLYAKVVEKQDYTRCEKAKQQASNGNCIDMHAIVGPGRCSGAANSSWPRLDARQILKVIKHVIIDTAG